MAHDREILEEAMPGGANLRECHKVVRRHMCLCVYVSFRMYVFMSVCCSSVLF